MSLALATVLLLILLCVNTGVPLEGNTKMILNIVFIIVIIVALGLLNTGIR